jgi:hypothetical protein
MSLEDLKFVSDWGRGLASLLNTIFNFTLSSRACRRTE